MATEAKAPADSQAVLSEVAKQSLEAWKCQFDTALQLVETITEGAAKMREWQLQAAVDAHANAAATQQAAAKAGAATDLLSAEMQWMRHNLEQAASYWRILFETGLETNSNLLKCVFEQQKAHGGPALPVDLDASKAALLEMVETAYSQWLDVNRRFYSPPPAGPATTGAGAPKDRARRA